MLNKIKDLLASSIKKIPASIGTKAIVYYAVVLAAEIILFNIAFVRTGGIPVKPM